MVEDSQQYKGFTIKIYQDDDTEDPRQWDNLGKMWCVHKNYLLGDEQSIDNDSDIIDLIGQYLCRNLEEDKDWYSKRHKARHFTRKNHMTAEAWVRSNVRKNCIILPVFLFEHSGISISTNRRGTFGVSKTGYIWVTREKVRDVYQWGRITKAREKFIIDQLKSEIETYDYYLTGSCYHYEVDDPNGDHVEDLGVGTFYGYDHLNSGLITEAKGAIDSHISWARKQHLVAVKRAIKSRIPLQYRHSFIYKNVGVNLHDYTHYHTNPNRLP